MSRSRQRGLALITVALAVRLAVCAWAWSRVAPTADGKFYHVVAQRIAQGHGYTWLWPDGAVTYAAHYPVGYPGLMGAIYWLMGTSPGWVMVANAAAGALGVWALYEVLTSFAERGNRAGQNAAWVVALYYALLPSLVLYTAGLMTEGMVSSCGMLVLLAAIRVRTTTGAPRFVWATTGVFLLGAASLLRPQSILLAPVFGGFLVAGAQPRWGQRLLGALLVTVCACLVVAPWTLRNCDKMERCLFVSANGGWNLLIGTYPEGKGAWVPLEAERVPIDCREVYQEAAKDACFARAGRRRILSRPTTWLSQIPAKWSATVDYSTAASDHLREAGAIEQPQHAVIAALEIVSTRVVGAFSLLGIFLWDKPTSRGKARHLRRLVLALGLLSFFTSSSWLGWLAIVVLGLASGHRLLRQPQVGFAVGAIASTLLVHAVFFGAARYALPMIFLAGPLCWYSINAMFSRRFC